METPAFWATWLNVGRWPIDKFLSATTCGMSDVKTRLLTAHKVVSVSVPHPPIYAYLSVGLQPHTTGFHLVSTVSFPDGSFERTHRERYEGRHELYDLLMTLSA